MKTYQLLQAVFVLPWATFWYLVGATYGIAKVGFTKGYEEWNNE